MSTSAAPVEKMGILKSRSCHVVFGLTWQLDFESLPELHSGDNSNDEALPSLHSKHQLTILTMLSSRALLRATRASVPIGIAIQRAVVSSQIRNYAASAAVDSKPPKALYGLDGTYASALVCSPGFFVAN